MKKAILLISLAALFCGCMFFGGGLKLSSDDQTYIKNAYDTPLELTVPKTESDICWARAKEWIDKYSSKKIQTANDFMIQTYNPGGQEYAFGYYVTRKTVADTVQIMVQCIVGNLYAKKDQDNNAHLLAHYIKTGQVVPKLIVKE
jgi:hypothetical protein